MKTLRSSETRLVGQWLQRGGQVVADEVAERIDWLLKSQLLRIGQSADGWTVLYQDPTDQRFWELTYPESGSHGGGPPVLQAIDRPEVQARYNV